MQSLTINHSSIEDISVLAAMTELESLHLSSDNISNLEPLRNLHQLKDIWLAANQIVDIEPLSQLDMDRLILAENPLGEAAYSQYIPEMLARNPYLDLVYDPVPEPGGLLFAVGGVLLLCHRRRTQE